MSESIHRVAVVGGGISGLATAFNLEALAAQKKVSLELTLFEKGAKLGGRISTISKDGYRVEEGANGFLNSKPSTLDLCSQIEMSDKLMYANSAAKKRYVYLDGKLLKLPSGPLDFALSQILTIPGKARLMSEILVPPKRDEADESVFDFGCRRIGEQATRRMLDALVTGIHAGDSRLLSVNAAFPRIVELERTYGSLFKAMPQVARQRKRDGTAGGGGTVGAPSGTLTSFEGGMSEMIEAISSCIKGNIRKDCGVSRLEKTANGWRVFADDESSEFDSVVLAAPAYRQAAMLEQVDSELSTVINSIPYAKAAVVGLGFNREDLARLPDGFGYIAPQLSKRDVLGVLWSSSIFKSRSSEDCFLMRAICGGWNNPKIVDLSDAELIELVVNEIKVVTGVDAKPVFSHIKRWQNAIPQYHVGHLDKLQKIETLRAKHSGLFLTGNCYRGIAMNECTADAQRTASLVMQD